VIRIPEKLYIGRLFYFTRYDRNSEYVVVYRDKKSEKCFYKRCRIDKFITDHEYSLCPDNCKLEIITSRVNSLYELSINTRIKDAKTLKIDLRDAPERGARARGVLITSKPIANFRFIGLAEESPDSSENPEPDKDAETELLPQKDAEKAESGNLSEIPVSQTTTLVCSPEHTDGAPVPSNVKSTVSDPADPPRDVPKITKKTKRNPTAKEMTKPQPSGAPFVRNQSEPVPIDTGPEGEPLSLTPEGPSKPGKNRKASGPKPSSGGSKKTLVSDDDLGITQPEFGF
jgi:hypothetical protein